MTTILILSGMAMLALGALVLGVALISRKPMPPLEEDNDGDEPRAGARTKDLSK